MKTRYMPQHFYCNSCGTLQYTRGDKAAFECTHCGRIHKIAQFSRPHDWFEHNEPENAWYDSSGNGELIIELQDSTDIKRFYVLKNSLILGHEWVWFCYHPAFIQRGVRPGERKGPIVLWDAQTGKQLRTLKGFHYTDELRGAQLLSDNRLITWARDFLIYIWDVNSGELSEKLPQPALLNEEQILIVSSRSFASLTDQQRKSYVNNCDRLSFNVKLMIKAGSESQCEILGPYSRPVPEGMSFKNFLILKHDPYAFSFNQELEYAEKGYSTHLRMDDGRFVFGGTTYGATGYVYIWDGGLNLTILYCGQHSCNFEIDGEIKPGVIQVRDYDRIMIFEDV